MKLSAVAAGVPSDRKAEEGAALAFMGQVPVRCVGPVAAGDQLYPSGRGDGLAVAQPHAKDETTRWDVGRGPGVGAFVVLSSTSGAQHTPARPSFDAGHGASACIFSPSSATRMCPSSSWTSSALSADEDSNFGSDDIPASAYAGAAGAVTAGSAVANPVGHSEELDYTGPELAHSAELDYAGGDDLPELLPREAAQAPAPRGFARPGDLSAGGGVV